MKTRLLAAVLTPLALVACSSAETPTATETPTVAAAPESKDVTADVKELAGDNGSHVTEASETEAGRVEITTDITDPRTDGGDEAAAAMAICKAVKEAGAWTHVSVLEADGTSFVIAGHPAHGEDCAEL